jgi:hypothetical protein
MNEIRWRTSTYSSSNGGNCVEVAAIDRNVTTNEAGWRKSTYSSNGGASCVEVGQAARVIAVRDTKQHRQGPVLRFTPAAWRRFADQVKRS